MSYDHAAPDLPDEDEIPDEYLVKDNLAELWQWLLEQPMEGWATC